MIYNPLAFECNGMLYIENSFCLVAFKSISICCMQHKADLVILQVLLLPCLFSNFFLPTFPSFMKWPSIKSCIFLFLLDAIVGLLTNTLQSSGLIRRMCKFLLIVSEMFLSVLLSVNIN